LLAWVVHDQIRKDAPKPERAIGEVFSEVSDPGVLGEQLEGVLERVSNAKCGVDAVVGDELLELLDVRFGFWGEPVRASHARFFVRF
jgi:hypothetical protein